MKKFFSIITLLIICTTLTACSNTVEKSVAENESVVSKKRSLEGLKAVNNSSTDYTINFVKTFEDLEAWSELIVIGEFIDNSELCYTRTIYDAGYQKDLILEGVSSCPMKITKVFAGDAEVGDVVNVLQEERIENDRFITHSELTPMQMGDEWLFCLRHAVDECYGDGYWCVSDSMGRYPTKNSGSNEVMCFSDYPELGVYRPDHFHEDFYNALIEKYGEF